MIVSYEKPPVWDRAVSELGANGNTVFTYGDTVYVPSGLQPTEDIFVHEAIHSKQQGEGPAAWWEQYFTDSEFRYCQELEAYRAQFKWFKGITKDRNAQARFGTLLAGIMAGKLYGNLGKHSEIYMAIVQ